ncbi:MAG: hypothetical protein KAU24_03230 [Candidatus Aenigmarchaeota archaeon]|nr:hypothetical protein [Candidatus Aenigmarchaeota archaeon]
MEVFRCDCERGFDLVMGGKEKTFDCPRCKTVWKAEAVRGYYRLLKWVE